MRPEESVAWKVQLLDEIFRALAAHPPLKRVLVFKGARVLDALLHGTRRLSLDLDSNLLNDFVESTPDRDAQLRLLERDVSAAVSKRFDSDSPVRYTLNTVHVRRRPKNAHPRGWDAYEVIISVTDHTRPGVRGLPSLHLDVAAPEALREDSIALLRIGDDTVWAYTLERIAGEKLRAFLSSLPKHREKLRRPGEAVRVKDIYDLAKIAHARPPADGVFWVRAGKEFHIACKSRFIDCEGQSTFDQDLAATRSAYEKDPTLPRDLSFDDAWEALRCIVGTLEENDLVPFFSHSTRQPLRATRVVSNPGAKEIPIHHPEHRRLHLRDHPQPHRDRASWFARLARGAAKAHGRTPAVNDQVR